MWLANEPHACAQIIYTVIYKFKSTILKKKIITISLFVLIKYYDNHFAIKLHNFFWLLDIKKIIFIFFPTMHANIEFSFVLWQVMNHYNNFLVYLVPVLLLIFLNHSIHGNSVKIGFFFQVSYRETYIFPKVDSFNL